jgi:hypothetical protein
MQDLGQTALTIGFELGGRGHGLHYNPLRSPPALRWRRIAAAKFARASPPPVPVSGSLSEGQNVSATEGRPRLL